MNYTEASSNNINSINNNSSSMKNLKLKKPKPKRYNCIFNKTTLQVLENLTITNEDKLLYILNNFKNIRIDPLIIKVLEERKSKKRIGLYESMLSEEQNTSSGNDKEKIQKKIINNNPNKNGIQNTQNEAIVPQVVKPSLPMDDKIIFSDLSKYNISIEIGMEKGKEEGIEIGKEEEKIKTAENMKKEQINTSIIVKITGLSPEDIEKL